MAQKMKCLGTLETPIARMALHDVYEIVVKLRARVDDKLFVTTVNGALCEKFLTDWPQEFHFAVTQFYVLVYRFNQKSTDQPLANAAI
jgi:hypothetical protein